MTRHLFYLLLVTTFLVVFVVFIGCGNSLVPIISKKYPGCQLLDYTEISQGYLEAKLQCGPLIKVVKLRDSR